MDFWKALLCGEIFIYFCYLIHGLVVYSYQGQYAFNPSYQGINPYNWQTAANSIELITGLIAACLYGNIGIKVLYNNVGRELFGWPVLETKKGKWLWVILVPVYWAVAFVVSVSIPQFSVFSAFVGAACILQFTYTFPPLLMLGFKAQRDAILPEESFDPTTGRVERRDHGMKRWMRGLKKEILWNTWDLVFGLGAATTAVLGIYASLSGMVTNYKSNPNLTGWTCNSPTG